MSLTQILGSTGAAVTAAFLGSRLGVAGTLIGAALASIISVVGGAIYTTSIKATRHRVALAIGAARGVDDVQDREPHPPTTSPVPAAPPTARRSAVSPRTGAPGRTRRPALRGVLVGSALSAAVFVAALTLVTGYESVSGTALAGGQAGGLTVLGGRQADQISGRSDDGGSGSQVVGSTTKSVTTSSSSPRTEPPAPSGSAVTTAPQPGAGTTAAATKQTVTTTKPTTSGSTASETTAGKPPAPVSTATSPGTPSSSVSSSSPATPTTAGTAPSTPATASTPAAGTVTTGTSPGVGQPR